MGYEQGLVRKGATGIQASQVLLTRAEPCCFPGGKGLDGQAVWPVVAVVLVPGHHPVPGFLHTRYTIGKQGRDQGCLLQVSRVGQPGFLGRRGQTQEMGYRRFAALAQDSHHLGRHFGGRRL